MTKDKKIECLFLTGMHRSGISAFAACFTILGVNLGQYNSTTPTAANKITMVHDILLRNLGCSWDMVGSLPDDWMETQAATDASERIRNLIEKHFEKNGLWAIADPRLCRLMPLWLPILKDMDINPGFIMIMRHPWEVARSLEKNNDTKLEQGLLLWLSSNKEAFDSCRQYPYTVTTYDQLLADPVSVLMEIGESFNIVYKFPVEKRIQNLLDVIRPERKHHYLSDLQTIDHERPELQSFAWLYDQINSHRSVLKIFSQEAMENPDIDPIAHESLPTQFYPDTLPYLKGNEVVQRQSTLQRNKIFNSYLSLIGQYERKHRDLELQRMQRVLDRTNIADTLFARLHFPLSEQDTDSGDKHSECLLVKDEWQQVRFLIVSPKQLRDKGLCFSPLNTRGVVHISAMSIVNTATNMAYWQAATPEDFNSIKLENALRLPQKDALFIMTSNNDGILTLPALPDLPDVPMELQAWLKVDTNQEMVAAAWHSIVNEKISLQNQLQEALTEKDGIAKRLEEKNRILSDKEQVLALQIEKRQIDQDKFQKAIEEQSKTIAEQNDRAANLEETVASLRQDKEHLANQVDQRTDEVSQRQLRVNELERQKGVAKQELDNRKARIKELEQVVGKAVREKDALEKEISTNKNRLSEKTNAADTLLAQVKQLTNERSQDQAHIIELEKQIAETNKELTAAMSQVAELEQAAKALQDDKESLKIQLSKAAAGIEQSDQRLCEFETKCANFRKEKDAYKAQTQTLTAKLEGRVQWIEAVELELDQSQVLYEKMRKAAEAANLKNKEYEGRLIDFKKLLADVSEQKSSIEEHHLQIEALQTTLTDKVKENDDLKKKLEGQVVSFNDANSALQTFRVKTERLEKESADKTKVILRMESEIKNRDQLLDEANTSIKKRFDELSKLSKLLKDTECEVSERTELAASQERKMDTLNADLSKMTDHAGLLEGKVKKLSSDVTVVTDKLQASLSEKEDLAHKFIEVDAMLSSKLAEVEDLRQQIAKLKSSVSWRITAPVRVLSGPFKKTSKPNTSVDAMLSLIRNSDLYDKQWYLEQYPDVADSGMDPVEHFLNHGASEGRDPSQKFDTKWYLKTYPDVSEKGVNPLVHYLMFGQDEGRKIKQDDH